MGSIAMFVGKMRGIIKTDGTAMLCEVRVLGNSERGLAGGEGIGTSGLRPQPSATGRAWCPKWLAARLARGYNRMQAISRACVARGLLVIKRKRVRAPL